MTPASSTCSFLVVVAVWALYAAGVHVFAGTPRVVGPLVRADLPVFPRATLLVVWHVTTVVLLVLAGTILAAAFSPWREPLLGVALLHSVGFLGLFLWVGTKEFGEPIRLPQWFLFGPLVIALGSSFTSRPAAMTAAGMLAALALVHFVWAANRPWPARETGGLGSFVFPETAGKQFKSGLPPRSATLAVALALLGMAAIALSSTAGSSWRWPARVMAATFLGRGIFGFLYRPWSPRLSQQPFATYNRAFYSPICLLLGAILTVESFSG